MYKSNVISKEMANSIKNDVKNNISFDDTIKRMAEELVKIVNAGKKDVF